MRLLLSSLLFCGLATASQSWVPAAPLAAVGPIGFPQPNDWRIEYQADHFIPAATVGILEFDSAPILYIVGAALRMASSGCPGIEINLASISAFRILAQRNTTTGLCTVDVWDEQTGQHLSGEAAITGPSITFSTLRFVIGSFYSPTQINAHVGMLRWYTSTIPTTSAPPRYITSSYGDMVDYEFEGNSNDLSGRGINFLPDTYWETQVLPPVPVLSSVGAYKLSGKTVASTIVGVPINLNASDSFSNADTGGVTCAYTQTSGPTVSYSAASNCVSTANPSAFGSAMLRLTVTDAGGSANLNIKLGGVVANATTGVVDVAAEANSYTSNGAKIATVVGPLQAVSVNPWSWAINRMFAMLDLAIFNTTPAGAYPNVWDTPAAGTISLTNTDPVTLVGVGTHFQRDVCGGAGNTTPVSATSLIIPWYHTAQPAYTIGRWNTTAVTCTDDTHLTIGNPSFPFGATRVKIGDGHFPFRKSSFPGCAPYLDCGLTYSIGDMEKWGNWFNSNNPGNYYDVSMACYEAWFASGLDDFRDCGRTIGRAWWIGYANQWEAYYVGDGSYGTQPRIAALEGIMVYGYENSVDVWPGLRQILYYTAGGSPPTGGSFWWNLYETNFARGFIGSLQDMRENAKMMGGLALAYLLDTDSTVRTHALEALAGTLNGMWIPGIKQHRWSAATVQPPQDPCSQGTGVFGNQANSIYVTVTDGSPNIVLHGTCFQFGAGTVNVSGTVVTGSGTVFTHSFHVGDTITVTTTSGSETKAISVITNDTALVTAPFAGTATGANFLINGWSEHNFGLDSPQLVPVWFCTACFYSNLFGWSTTNLATDVADIGGDTIAYLMASVTDETHAVLSTPYSDPACPGPAGCNKVMEAARTAGIGSIDYMGAMHAGVLAGWVYQAFVMAGDTVNAAATKALVQEYALGIPGAFKNNSGDMWGATLFAGCVLYPNSDNCLGSNIISGEYLKAISAIYLLAPTPELKTVGDAGYNYLWGRTGYTKPAEIPLNGPCDPHLHCFLWEATDDSEHLGGFMLLPGAGTNKWAGYYWGYGFGLSWPAVRGGSVVTVPPPTTTHSVILSGSAQITGIAR